MRRRNRTSLSSWYAKPDSASDEPAEDDLQHDDRCDSPTSKRSNPSFFIGDESDAPSHDCSPSPRKKAALAVAAAEREPSIDPAMMVVLRGICAEYFENNVTPVVRYVTQTQEQLVAQLKEVSASLACKANAEDVTSLAMIEQVAARAATSRADDSKVAIHVRLEEIATAMNQKANHTNVPTLAQLGSKANVKEQVELEQRVQAAERKVLALSEEFKSMSQGGESADITKVKAIFSAAGLRVDRQLKELRQQMLNLREERLGKDVGERWPGRRLDSDARSVTSLHSDNDSDRLSLGASANGFSSAMSTGSGTASISLEPEEKAEFKRIQAIVAAAGTAFSRELRELKVQMRDVRTELHKQRASKNISTS
jgi:hypothetical protein